METKTPIDRRGLGCTLTLITYTLTHISISDAACRLGSSEVTGVQHIPSQSVTPDYHLLLHPNLYDACSMLAVPWPDDVAAKVIDGGLGPAVFTPRPERHDDRRGVVLGAEL